MTSPPGSPATTPCSLDERATSVNAPRKPPAASVSTSDLLVESEPVVEIPAGVTAIAIDIEGTTSATEFVHQRLFPWARQHLESWIAEHGREPQVAAQLAEVRREVGAVGTSDRYAVEVLRSWIDQDVKATPLKAIQGWMWQEGFASGQLESHLFDDVAPALRAWHGAGLHLAVYSSGSVTAQQSWFGHSPAGDLRPLFVGWFDTENAGPKRDEDSYRRVAAGLGSPPNQLLFLSDITAELDAARGAGWHTVGIRRPGEPAWGAGVGRHPEARRFA